MKLKKLNNLSNVCSTGCASYQMIFESDAGYAEAIVQLSQMYGVGHPYRNDARFDANKNWLFRNANVDHGSGGAHKIYLTSEDQITFCKLAFKEND